MICYADPVAVSTAALVILYVRLNFYWPSINSKLRACMNLYFYWVGLIKISWEKKKGKK